MDDAIRVLEAEDGSIKAIVDYPPYFDAFDTVEEAEEWLQEIRSGEYDRKYGLKAEGR